VYNPAQVCCGQPAFNAGHFDDARRVAGRWLGAFNEAECIVCPSGSCTAMVRCHYPDLFADSAAASTAAAVALRVHELSEFLARLEGLPVPEHCWTGRLGFHNSCHSYRGLGVRDEPLGLLRRLVNGQVVVPPGEPQCCGFGGLFCVKYAPVSAAMARHRLAQFEPLQVDRLVTNDPGCLMHLRQEAAALGWPQPIEHLAEFLASCLDRPAAAGGDADG
jgi:L-lactate dehydrogenase complex protein LldE